MSSRNPPTNFNPSSYSNLREYVEAVQGSPIDYDNPQQQDILNAAIAAMYGGKDTSALQSFFPQAAARSQSTVVAPLNTQSIANTSGLGSTGIGVSGASLPTTIDTGAGETQGALSQATTNTSTGANNVLGGIILAGDSFLSGDKAVNDIAAQTGQVVTNTAVGGQTSTDVLNQLNNFTANGGTFAPGSTVILNVGGNDLLGGIDPATVQNNINNLVSRLGALGVNVVLSGASDVGSVADVTGSTNLVMSDIYNNIANSNSNVTLVDSMSGLLNQKNLVDETGFHLTAPGQAAFNTSLSNAYLQSIGAAPISFSDQNIINFARDNNLTADQAMALAPSFGVDPERVQQLLSASAVADTGTTSGAGALSQVANTAGLGATGIGTSDTANSIAADTGNVASVYKSIYGTDADAQTINELTSRFGSTIDANELSSLVVNDTSLRDNPTGVVKTLQQQILDQGTTQYWSGEGFGSAEQNAADMARMLASAGITDINQFGKVTVADDVAVTPVYEQKLMDDGEGGTYMGNVLVGYTDANGKAVDPSMVTAAYDYDGGVAGYTAPVGTKEVFGNKETGVPLEAHYDRAGGNVFSGTFAGKGSTNYGVQFKEDGTPVFYTQYGGSTNTLNQIMSDLGPLGQIAFAVATGGLSIPQQIAAQAALSLASGADLKDIVKNIAVSTVLQGIPKSDIITSGTNYLNQIDSSGVLGKAFSSAASSGTKAVLTGQDIGNAILSGAVGGGTAGAIDLMTSSIDGFSDLSKSQQNMVRNAISGVVSGQPLDQVLINTAIQAGTDAVRSAATDNSAQAAFVDAKRAGASDAEAKDASDAVTKMAEANETFDGSGFDSQDAAMNAALADGKDKFTFGGKKFTIDNSAAQIADFTNSVLADERAATDLRTKSDSEWGDLAGAQSAATARNTVTIGNAEADNVDEALYLARTRDPSATNFTFDGKTYTISASQSQMADANRTANLAEIKDLPKFSDAYARARTLLGPNQTFEWNGKQYSTATAEERPDLSVPSIEALNARNLATVTDASRTVGAQTDTAARDAAAINTANLAAQSETTKPLAETSFLGQIYKDLNNRLNLNGIAANEYLKNNPNSPITQSVSTAFEAAGELQRNMGGIALAFDNKPLADALVKGGSKIQDLGQSIGGGPQDSKNWKDTLDLIDKAKGFEKVVVMAGRIMDGTSGLARQAEVELRQELPALFLGGGSVRALMVASGLIDTADTGGNAVLEGYDSVIKKGGTHQEALAAGRKAGAAAAATEAVIQATMGKLGEFAAGKLDNVLSKGSTKIGSEAVVEAAQEGGSSAAVDLALGNAIDVNKALTQTVVGGAVGKSTAVATSPVDAAQTESINNSISTAVASNNPATVNSAITSSVQTSLNNGASVDVAVGNTVGAAITNGADAATSINNVVTTAIESGADASQVVASTITSAANAGANTTLAINSTVTSAITGGANASQVVSSAIISAANTGASVDTAVATSVAAAVKAGADVNTVVEAATQAATSTGNNVTVASDANVVTINNATTNTQTTVDTATGVTTTVDNANNVTTTVSGNTTTAVDANNNTTSQTTVEGNTQTTVVADANTNTNTQTVVDTKTNTTTSTTVDANNNTTTQTTISGDTQTTVLTDSNTNTQTTVTVNTNTGEVIDQKETSIPDGWKPPVIEAPVVPPSVTPPTAASSTANAAKQAAKLKAPQGAGAGAGGFGLPTDMDLNPASLRSWETQKAIDPLARVKEIQAEFERDAMIQNVDPRLMQILQQRSDPQQQAQQFDNDIGALAKLLSGKPDAPSASNYYSYGAEDSIDDILGGKAANYKEGGFVEPLKASGGSMALPLLVKSGGALGHYKGRENFKEGKHVAGEGDGQSDDIPAWLADGEFVFPADVVSALGNGSTKAGTDKLYEMMHNIRERARSKGPKDLPPPALKSPLDYLKSSKRSTS